MKRALLKKRPRIHPAQAEREEDREPRTKQAFKDECDINNIVRHFKKTGMVRHLAKGHPQYLDVSAMPDFRTTLDHVMAVDTFFLGLDAETRAKFDNDPALFMDVMNDPERRDDLSDWGLLPPDPDKAPAPSEAPQAATEGEEQTSPPTEGASS